MNHHRDGKWMLYYNVNIVVNDSDSAIVKGLHSKPKSYPIQERCFRINGVNRLVLGTNTN